MDPPADPPMNVKTDPFEDLFNSNATGEGNSTIDEDFDSLFGNITLPSSSDLDSFVLEEDDDEEEERNLPAEPTPSANASTPRSDPHPSFTGGDLLTFNSDLEPPDLVPRKYASPIAAAAAEKGRCEIGDLAANNDKKRTSDPTLILREVAPLAVEEDDDLFAPPEEDLVRDSTSGKADGDEEEDPFAAPEVDLVRDFTRGKADGGDEEENPFAAPPEVDLVRDFTSGKADGDEEENPFAAPPEVDLVRDFTSGKADGNDEEDPFAAPKQSHVEGTSSQGGEGESRDGEDDFMDVSGSKGTEFKDALKVTETQEESCRSTSPNRDVTRPLVDLLSLGDDVTTGEATLPDVCLVASRPTSDVTHTHTLDSDMTEVGPSQTDPNQIEFESDMDASWELISEEDGGQEKEDAAEKEKDEKDECNDEEVVKEKTPTKNIPSGDISMDFSILERPGFSHLNFDITKHKRSLSQKGSISRRKRPTRAAILTQGTDSNDSLFQDSTEPKSSASGPEVEGQCEERVGKGDQAREVSLSPDKDASPPKRPAGGMKIPGLLQGLSKAKPFAKKSQKISQGEVKDKVKDAEPMDTSTTSDPQPTAFRPPPSLTKPSPLARMLPIPPTSSSKVLKDSQNKNIFAQSDTATATVKPSALKRLSSSTSSPPPSSSCGSGQANNALPALMTASTTGSTATKQSPPKPTVSTKPGPPAVAKKPSVPFRSKLSSPATVRNTDKRTDTRTDTSTDTRTETGKENGKLEQDTNASSDTTTATTTTMTAATTTTTTTTAKEESTTKTGISNTVLKPVKTETTTSNLSSPPTKPRAKATPPGLIAPKPRLKPIVATPSKFESHKSNTAASTTQKTTNNGLEKNTETGTVPSSGKPPLPGISDGVGKGGFDEKKKLAKNSRPPLSFDLSAIVEPKEEEEGSKVSAELMPRKSSISGVCPVSPPVIGGDKAPRKNSITGSAYAPMGFRPTQPDGGDARARRDSRSNLEGDRTSLARRGSRVEESEQSEAKNESKEESKNESKDESKNEPKSKSLEPVKSESNGEEKVESKKEKLEEEPIVLSRKPASDPDKNDARLKSEFILKDSNGSFSGDNRKDATPARNSARNQDSVGGSNGASTPWGVQLRKMDKKATPPKPTVATETENPINWRQSLGRRRSSVAKEPIEKVAEPEKPEWAKALSERRKRLMNSGLIATDAK